ncbi:neuronal acetylcholine receptor subunit alpha-10-like isoform X2 [Dendropsophus ebraccatus]
MPHLPLTMPPERGGGALFSLRFTTFAVGTVCLPLCGFLFCVLWSLLFNFEETTATHCGVPNYLPSISAAIGGVTPQRYIWRLAIGLHSAPRLLVAVAYLNFYHSGGASYRRCHINFLLNVFEILSLLLLTYVSSNENHGIHQLAFIFFMFFSLMYMMTTIRIWSITRKYSVTAEERRSYICKKWLFLFNLTTFLISLVFYYYHNMYCESGGVLGAQGKFAYKLMNDLFANYSNALRPVEDMDKAMNVTLQVTLSQIIDMDERNQILMAYLWIRQVWYDAYLRWNKDDYDGLDTIRIPSSYVWRPDIVLYNNADDQFTGSMETNVVIRYDGQIMWDSPAITKSSCKVDVSFFPFDGQQCRLTFGSWTYNGNQIDILNHLDTGDLTDFVENVEWEVLGMPAKKNVITYGCCSEPYPDVTYTLILKRRASFYIFNLLLPCVMISFLAPLGFYLPADSGEKVSLGVTVLLALTVFQLLVAESMPPSENVPLIGKYYIATMTMITASTALTIFIMNIHHCGPEAKPVPKWAKKYILQYMSRIFFVYEVGESCRRPKTETEKPPKVQVMNGQAKLEDPGAILKESDHKDTAMKEDLNWGKEDASGNGHSAWKQPGKYENSSNQCGGGNGHGCGECPTSHCLCHNERLLKNIEYMANCFREQKAAQKRTGEWKKVAKVMDRFFMWVFFIMVFFMSVLIMGKAI